MNRAEHAIEPPPVEIAPDNALGAASRRGGSVLAIGAEDVEGWREGRPASRSSAAAGLGWDVRLDQSPPGIGDVAGASGAFSSRFNDTQPPDVPLPRHAILWPISTRICRPA